MTSWGECLGYTGELCPQCGRCRVELYENNKRVCEKCDWCVEDESYVDWDAVYAEDDYHYLDLNNKDINSKEPSYFEIPNCFMCVYTNNCPVYWHCRNAACLTIFKNRFI